MNNIFTLTTTLFAAITLVACASNPTQNLAIQKADNQYEVTGMAKSQLQAKNNAIAAANNTCGKIAAPILIDEKTQYTGVLNGVVDEKTGQLITAAAGVLGTVLGTPTNLEKDTDYQTTLTFSCKANS